MRGLAAVFIACSVSLVAQADPADFEDAVNIAHWSGCVYEEGLSPYPIRLAAQDNGFLVEYPGLCTGAHNAMDGTSPFDAIEIISLGADQCAQSVPLTYTIKKRKLRIEYHLNDRSAQALLRPALPGAALPTCDTIGAIS
ncbi:hypothetical protein [Henriciella litoralis]|uniref:hypothetical protein n=1 Tax=Henriciella litoralis TaxID=568102 RepID=UPI0009FE4FFB|nr:hypothetical protein [Henriciella litoralis]